MYHPKIPVPDGVGSYGGNTYDFDVNDVIPGTWKLMAILLLSSRLNKQQFELINVSTRVFAPSKT